MDQLLEALFGKNHKAYQAFGLLKLGRVLRLNKIISYLNVEEDIKAIMKFSKMMLGLTIYIHIFACLWWMIIKENKTWIPWRHIGSDDE